MMIVAIQKGITIFSINARQAAVVARVWRHIQFITYLSSVLCFARSDHTNECSLTVEIHRVTIFWLSWPNLGRFKSGWHGPDVLPRTGCVWFFGCKRQWPAVTATEPELGEARLRMQQYIALWQGGG
jgi:hypothetical protein